MYCIVCAIQEVYHRIKEARSTEKDLSAATCSDQGEPAEASCCPAEASLLATDAVPAQAAGPEGGV
ncbi:MAG: hypothetical protein GXX99_01755 [Clostridiales bacterium]|nr:hypothetical protein [Clostridiales bacterium]